jgi:hypothetical protein
MTNTYPSEKAKKHQRFYGRNPYIFGQAFL